MKKLLSLIIIISLLLAIGVSVYATSDTPSSWAKEEVESAIINGYVPEHLQSKYQDPITREEFAELFVTAVITDFNRNLDSINTMKSIEEAWGDVRRLTVDNFLENVTTTEAFTDTNNKYVKMANILGMVNGVGNSKFNPYGLITREQAAIMFVNYMQTADAPTLNKAKWLDDINEASSWAKDAVAWAYEAGYILGTKAPKLNIENGDILEHGHFDTKGNMTREQAIIIVARLGKGGRDLLKNLIIRGFYRTGIMALNAGIKVDKDTIRIADYYYDHKYDSTKEYMRTQRKLAPLVDKYTAGELYTACIQLNGSGIQTHDLHHLERVLAGENVKYASKFFTIEYNAEDGSRVVLERIDKSKYVNYLVTLSYVDDNDMMVVLKFEEVLE